MRHLFSTFYLRTKLRPIFKRFREFEAIEKYTRIDVESLQIRRLNQIIQYAWEKVPFYCALWNEHGSPKSIQFLSDMNKFPTVDKKMLRKGIADGTAISKDFPNQRGYSWVKTTGSSGQPFLFPLDVESNTAREGARLSIKKWYGFEFGMTEVKLWRYTLKKPSTKESVIRTFDNCFKVCIYDPDNPISSALDERRLSEIATEIENFNPEFIDGFVSALYILALHIQKHRPLKLPRLKAITTGAELLTDAQRNKISEAFKVPVLNRYGGTESSIIAHDILRDGNFRPLVIREDRLYLETLPTEQSADQEEIVFTDFDNIVMPLIRYKNGDLGEIDNKFKGPLPGFRNLKAITGRINEFFRLPSGALVSSHLWQNYFREEKYIENFQLIQRKLDFIEVNLVINPKLYSEDRFLIVKKRLEAALPGCQVKWSEVESITPGPGGKLSQAICLLDKP